MPSQADEEAHQLSYLQKHMVNILALLAESVEGEGDESLVVTLGYIAIFFSLFTNCLKFHSLLKYLIMQAYKTCF